MKFEVEVDYLDPIELGESVSIAVLLPSGMGVRVFSDMIYVFTEDDWRSHRDGKKVWAA